MAADPIPPLSWASIPTELLVSELSKRQNSEKPPCGSAKIGAYDTASHVLALVLILTLSTLACGFPLISRRRSTKDNRPQSQILFICQHFGTGVLIATAFVHLLPTAFISLNDPCLPDVFSKHYRALPGLISMVSVLAVVALESYLTTRGARHSHSHNAGKLWESAAEGSRGRGDEALLSQAGAGLAAKRQDGHRPYSLALGHAETQGLVAGASPLPGSTPLSALSAMEGLNAQADDDDDSDLEIGPAELHRQDSTGPVKPPPRPQSSLGMENPAKNQRLLMQCLLLEAGILFHSVFIGMALSVAQGSTFVVFLIAISFHQSFEGLALGSRIAAIQFPKKSVKPWLMVLAFGATTPLGQAIGLIVHNMYDPLSQAGLLVVGFMNAISSGLLVFAGLVQLIAEDFLTDKSYEVLKGKKRLHAYLAVLGGAGLMAIVGAFA